MVYVLSRPPGVTFRFKPCPDLCKADSQRDCPAGHQISATRVASASGRAGLHRKSIIRDRCLKVSMMAVSLPQSATARPVARTVVCQAAVQKKHVLGLVRCLGSSWLFASTAQVPTTYVEHKTTRPLTAVDPRQRCLITVLPRAQHLPSVRCRALSTPVGESEVY